MQKRRIAAPKGQMVRQVSQSETQKALSDALSTAFMVMDRAEITALCERLGQVEALEIHEE